MVACDERLEKWTLLSSREVAAFAAVGLHTGHDLLEYFPRRHEDRRRFDAFPTMPTSAPVCLRGGVIDATRRRFGSGGGAYEAVVMDGAGGVFGSGKVTFRWFNMPHVHKWIATGHQVIAYGKVKEQSGRLIIDHPEVEIIREGDAMASIHLERIAPIYKNLTGISQHRLREIIYQFLSQACPQSMRQRHPLPVDIPRDVALHYMHFPEQLEQVAQARRQFAREEFFIMQLNVAWRKSRYHQQLGRAIGQRTTSLKQFHANLTFELTDAQKRSIKEIVADLRSTRPMHRLLQGDVGSGKTLVAMAAMLLAIDSNVQAALMAPTQLLAEQHYQTFCRFLTPLGIRILLKTGSQDRQNYEGDAQAAQMIIGTHALLYESVRFSDLGFVVIDEQHKFGVSQRASFIQQGRMPHVLVMTATPIPRTLMMTVYGDLDVSVLDEKPPGRGELTTSLRVNAKQAETTRFVKEQLAQGRQAYLVYPLVEESESLKLESATDGFECWQKRLTKFRVGLIHGKQASEEKDHVMQQFRSGAIAAMVSTSVIEVGVDVANATVMVVHHAERFGLAQLHQLRGRIGRGADHGYCLLLTGSKNADALEKLQVLERTSDGFEIAEADLRLRGPGDVLGKVQSGIASLRFTDQLGDYVLLAEARALADQFLLEDPTLSAKHQYWRAWITDLADDSLLPSTA